MDNAADGTAVGQTKMLGDGEVYPPQSPALTSIVSAVKKAEEVASDKFVSTKGVVFALRRVSRFVIVEAGRKIPDPPVPTYHNEAQDRWLPNPADPEYVESLARASYDRTIAVLNSYIALGTRVTTVAPGTYSVEAPEWAEELAVAGIIVPESGPGRYVAWARLYIMDDDEFTEFTSAVMKFSGHVSQADVEQAEASLKSNGTGPSDKQSLPAPSN